jgi:hypothetical protein
MDARIKSGHDDRELRAYDRPLYFLACRFASRIHPERVEQVLGAALAQARIVEPVEEGALLGEDEPGAIAGRLQQR